VFSMPPSIIEVRRGVPLSRNRIYAAIGIDNLSPACKKGV
jgi:hypothetical protein